MVYQTRELREMEEKMGSAVNTRRVVSRAVSALIRASVNLWENTVYMLAAFWLFSGQISYTNVQKFGKNEFNLKWVMLN